MNTPLNFAYETWTQGKRLTLVMKIFCKTAIEFGQKHLGIESPAQLSHYTTDRVGISINMVAKLYAIGIAPEWLLYGTGNPWSSTEKGEQFKKLLVEDERFRQYFLTKKENDVQILSSDDEKAIVAIAMKLLSSNRT